MSTISTIAKPLGEPAGLFTSTHARVPLKGVTIEVKAAGVAARVTVAQRYQNTEDVPVEAVYSFPLDEGSAVCAFEVEVGGKRIIGKVEEREKAFEQYDQAMASGNGAFLMDQDRPNIFTASVGNLLPKQEAIVRITYVTELEQTGDAIRLMVPTTISPRYIPRDQLKTIDPAELDHITPPTVIGGVPYGLKLSIEYEASADVREISCPSHPASVALAGRVAKVQLMGDDIQLDRDFILNIALAKPHEASAIVARDGDGVRALMLNLFPDLTGFKRGPAEFVFVIDRSGSMEGASINQARSALLVALRALEEGDRFNVIGFGTSFESMFDACVPYSQATLDEAARRISALAANLGGTEMLKPLTYAVELMPRTKLPRQVLLLTDGQAGNEAELLALATRNAKTAHIFTFGVGSGVSEHLLKGLARASGGQAELIHPNERIEPKVLRQMARIASASIMNVRIDWGNLKTDLVAPAEAPQLYNGDRFTVYARVIGGVGGEVSVLADSPNGALKFPVRVDLEQTATADSPIPVLMARKAIQELEEGRGEARGSAQQNRKPNLARTRILDLALRYNLISSATSFVAIEERPGNAQAQQAELRRIPVALTNGWGNVDAFESRSSAPAQCFAMAPTRDVLMGRSARAISPAPSVSASAAMPPAPMEPLSAPGSTTPLKDTPSLLERAKSLFKSSGAAPDASKVRSRAAADDPFLTLSLAQQADGSFALNDEFVTLSGIKRDEFDRVAAKLGGDRAIANRIVATVVALELYERRFANRKSEWRAMAEKAQRWLDKQKVAVPAGAAGLRGWVNAELKW